MSVKIYFTLLSLSVLVNGCSVEHYPATQLSTGHGYLARSDLVRYCWYSGELPVGFVRAEGVLVGYIPGLAMRRIIGLLRILLIALTDFPLCQNGCRLSFSTKCLRGYDGQRSSRR